MTLNMFLEFLKTTGATRAALRGDDYHSQSNGPFLMTLIMFLIEFFELLSSDEYRTQCIHPFEMTNHYCHVPLELGF